MTVASKFPFLTCTSEETDNAGSILEHVNVVADFGALKQGMKFDSINVYDDQGTYILECFEHTFSVDADLIVNATTGAELPKEQS